MKDLLDNQWARPWEDVVTELDVYGDKGLDLSEEVKRRRQVGPNRLREVKPKSGWAILFNQFKNLIVAFVRGFLAFLGFVVMFQGYLV